MTAITEVKAYPIAVPLRQTLWTAHEPLKDASMVLVEVKTSGGISGFGQISSGPLRDVCAWVERLGNVARGMNALAHIDVWERLFGLTSPRPGGVAARDGLPPPLPRSARPQIMAAIGGIDIALWDVKGKAAGMPVYSLLGAENRPVFTYGTGGYYVPGAPHSAYAKELAGFVANGYRGVKLKTGAETVKEEVERIRAVREAIGPDVMLMLDMNAAYDLETCIGFARAVEPLAPFWLEEPLHWYLQPTDFARLAAATPIPLAHGERELHRFTARDFITQGAIRYLQFDSTRYAGFTESLRLAHLASQHGVRITPHHAPELHAHLVAAFPEAGFGVESHGDEARDPIWHGLFRKRAEVRASYVHMNDAPGFGIEIDWAFAEKHAVR